MRSAFLTAWLLAAAMAAPAQPLEELRARADRGDADAQHALGQRYSGLGGDRIDLQQAHAYTRKAAEQGHLRAQVDLAFLLYNGNAQVPRDLAEAYRWFRRAAEGGSVRAQCQLGDFHRDGLGGARKDPALAVEWYRRSAGADDPCAPKSQYALYAAHWSGAGVRQDRRAAIGWLKKSAQAGNPIAQKRLAEHYLEGRGVPRDAALAAEWRRRSREGVAPHDDAEHAHGAERPGGAGKAGGRHAH